MVRSLLADASMVSSALTLRSVISAVCPRQEHISSPVLVDQICSSQHRPEPLSKAEHCMPSGPSPADRGTIDGPLR